MSRSRLWWRKTMSRSSTDDVEVVMCPASGSPGYYCNSDVSPFLSTMIDCGHDDCNIYLDICHLYHSICVLIPMAREVCLLAWTGLLEAQRLGDRRKLSGQERQFQFQNLFIQFLGLQLCLDHLHIFTFPNYNIGQIQQITDNYSILVQRQRCAKWLSAPNKFFKMFFGTSL